LRIGQQILVDDDCRRDGFAGEENIPPRVIARRKLEPLAGSERSDISAETRPRQPPMLVEQGEFVVETDLFHIRGL
jgi:hypothetical protein